MTLPLSDMSGLPQGRTVEPLLPPGMIKVQGGTNGGYLGPPPGQTVTGGSQAANTLFSVYFMIPDDFLLTELAINVTVAGAGNARLGIYACRSINDGLPGKLLLDAGTVSVNVTNTLVRLTGLSLRLKRGWYCAAYVADVACTVVRTNGGQFGWTPFGAGAVAIEGVSRAFTYAQLPVDETYAVYGTNNPTAVFAKGDFL